MRDLTTLITEGQQTPEVRRPGADPYWAELRTGDPPIALLQLSPSYQGGILPDGVWQRVPIGAAGQVLQVDPTAQFVQWANNPAGFANPLTTAGDIIIENATPATVRLPIGLAGQVLTVVGGLPAWAVPATGFANPMTALGDLITGAASGVAGRLAVGTAGQVLTVSAGVPTWQNSAAGFANPMTTAGDIIIENATPAPARLAAGAAGQVLTMVAGLPAWQNSAAGFANPMTALGDIITAAGGGAAQRLPAGATGQVLTISAGTPVWANSPAGFANPMTTQGDIIIEGAGAVATRLPIGAAGQVLTSASGLPAWATPGIGVPIAGPAGHTTVWQLSSQVFLVLPLAFYGLTGDDAQWVNTAFTNLPTWVDPDTSQTYAIGQVYLTTGVYTPAAQITKPPQADLLGAGMGTVLRPSGGTFSTLFSHHPATSGTTQNLTKSGSIRNLHLDGVNTTGAAVGVDIGDGNGHTVHDVWIANYDGGGAVGLWVNNTHFFTEKGNFKNIRLWNNETGCLMSTAVGDVSHEYNDYELHLRTYAQGTGPNTGLDQRAVVVSGVHFNGSLLVRGNMIAPFTVPPTGGHFNPAMLTVLNTAGNAGSVNGHVDFHMEVNGGGTAPFKIYLGNTNGTVVDTTVTIGDNGAGGVLRFNGGQDPVTPAAGQFAFKGIMDDINALRRVQAPTPPLTGVGLQNNQCDAFVYITGGTVSSVTVDGVSQPNNTGPYFVGWNRFITVNYTGTLTWTWVNAS